MKASTSRVLTEGLFAGLIGYAVVALFLGVVDLLTGRSFFWTAAFLGQTLLGGFGEPGGDAVTAGAVFAYNGVHLLVFLVVGLAVAWLVYEVEIHPAFWYVAFFVFLGAFFLSLVVLMAVGDPGTGALPWWRIAGANVAAALCMGVYLHRLHPRLRERIELHGDPEFEDE